MSIAEEPQMTLSPHAIPVGIHSNGEQPQTLHALLAQRAAIFGDQTAYTYLGVHGDDVVSYAELNRRAKAIAVEVRKVAKPGDRALLVFPAGLDFITSFFGCLYAGVLAVPATYPKPRRPMPRLTAISQDCDATLALTTSQTISTMGQGRAESGLDNMPWIAVDEIDDAQADDCCPSDVDRNDLAFLQYTSGSTSEPRGVMVSHGNLLHNLEVIRCGFGLDPANTDTPIATGVFWLPAYHDMGLIGGILETLYVGGHSVLMSPAAFLQRPIGWVEAISKYKARVSGAPNFAYEICASRATDEQVAALDLSSWKVAFCGAEPIRAATLNAFRERFAPAKFPSTSFYPCYGLAESTLLATGGRGPSQLVLQSFVRESLEKDVVEIADNQSDPRAQTFVGCGLTLNGEELVIVDPATNVVRDKGRIGEIWLRGGSIAKGYWNREEDSRETFGGYLADSGKGPYLRTGDLGFVSNGQLYVTGRVKDVIIIRGRNHYPQDIERTVGDAHDALRLDSGAVFSLNESGEDELAIVQEVDRHYRKADFDEVIRQIRRAVSESHELEAHTVVLIRHASLPRTTSGKSQRHMCRKQLLQGELNELARWTKDARPCDVDASDEDAARRGQAPKRLVTTERPLTVEEVDRLAERVESWLLTWMVERAAIPSHEVDRNKPFAEYGLDSLTAVELSQQLEDWLGVEVVPTVAWNYPTPATLSKYLAGEASGLNSNSTADVTAVPIDDEFAKLLSEIENLSEKDAEALLDQDPQGS